MFLGILLLKRRWVPNAPCGVESCNLSKTVWRRIKLFLMHRVELKVISLVKCSGSLSRWFLMHRVELKVSFSSHHGTTSF